MPATARRSKSEAYEKGVREGKAMAARSRSMEPEEEEEEGEEEEMDMAMQPGHSRKRSAKGAKQTKAPMDGMYGKKPMDGEGCGCGGRKGKGKCDGNCGSMRKRSDSLTPLEYLAACDLGIQDRSATYIRARLDTTEARNDLKCGKGAISEGEKCHVGTAQQVQPKKPGKTRTIASTGAILGGLVLNAGATGYGLGKTLSGDLAGAGRAFQLAGAGQALMGAGARGIGLKKESKKLFANAALTAGAGTFLREQQTGELAGGLRKGRMALQNRRSRRQRSSLEQAFRKPSAKRPPGLDSMFADGFAPGNFDI